MTYESLSKKYATYENMSEKEVVISLTENGMKAVELVSTFAAIQYEFKNNLKTDIRVLIDNMVSAGELMEIEYCLPHMDYRVKSMYFPVGTLINKIDKSKK